MLQFITHTHPTLSVDEYVTEVLEGGCRWIQLRMKEASVDEIRTTALRLLPLCRSYGATFIIDDHLEIAIEAGADGVHLGKTDMPPAEARRLAGSGFIIGGTANSTQDVMQLAADGVDYIGLGPFRFTHTKKNLSTLLGCQGYTSVMQATRKAGISLPVVAIGGIEQEDIPSLLATGITGVALSGTLLRAGNIEKKCREIINTIAHYHE